LLQPNFFKPYLETKRKREKLGKNKCRQVCSSAAS